MTREERKLALYCLKASSDYHSEVCEECIKYPNCDHVGQDDVTETIIKALDQKPCDDTVSREQAKSFLYERLNRLNNDELYDIFSVIIDDMYNELPPVQPKSGWIPVSEKLPEKGGDYLVTTKWKGSYSGDVYTETNMAVYREKEKEWDCAGIVAWMPLPEPYEPSN